MFYTLNVNEEKKKKLMLEKKINKNFTSSIKTTLHSQSAHFCKQINAKRFKGRKKKKKTLTSPSLISEKIFFLNKRNCPFMPMSKGWGVNTKKQESEYFANGCLGWN